VPIAKPGDVSRQRQREFVGAVDQEVDVAVRETSAVAARSRQQDPANVDDTVAGIGEVGQQGCSPPGELACESGEFETAIGELVELRGHWGANLASADGAGRLE
jgi:hypothetical protein